MDLNKELVLASEAGNEKTVIELLDKGADPNAMGPNSGALHCAAFNGHAAIVRLLLEKGANPNVADKQSYYPLHLAASKKELQIVKQLLAHGADVNSVTNSLGTVLHVAAAIDFHAILDLPEIRTMALEAKDHIQKTALNVAASFGSYTMGWRLVELGADVNTLDDSGSTPLLNVLLQLDATKIEEWSSVGENSGINVKYQIINGCFRYIKPYKGGANELGRVLSMSDQYDIANYSWSAPGLLAYVKCVYLAQNLVTNGADVNVRNQNGNTPMILACSVGEPEVINVLAKKGATFDVKNDKGIMPLHYLARSKRLDGLKAYYKWNENADSNLLDNNGWTPGHYLADIGGHADMAKLLIKNGLDLTLGSTKDLEDLKAGITARDVAQYWKDDAMAALLTPKKKK